MRFTARIVDDLLRKVFKALLASKLRVSSTRGDAVEITGVLLELKLPRARLSRTETRGKPFSCLGEFLWYLSKDNKLEFIRHYLQAYEEESDDGETVYGGYGPRLFNLRGQNQVTNVINLLKRSPSSRRAVIQLFNAEDIAYRRKEIPCTCTLQFLIRRKKLHLITTMRSNDAYKGLPHDIFCFTMLQELIARTLNIELGLYRHFVGSLHLYDYDRDNAEQYLSEALQSTVLMPPMPTGDPWPSIQRVLDAEHRLRNKLELNPSNWNVAPYWADLIRLLQIFAATGDAKKIDAVKGAMAFKQYAPYIESRKDAKPREIQSTAPQLLLPL